MFLTYVGAIVNELQVTDVLQADYARPFWCVMSGLEVGPKRTVGDRSRFWAG
jgi:hypothetical protein